MVESGTLCADARAMTQTNIKQVKKSFFAVFMICLANKYMMRLNGNALQQVLFFKFNEKDTPPFIIENISC